MRIVTMMLATSALLVSLTACGAISEESNTAKLEAHSTIYQLAEQSELLLGAVSSDDSSLDGYEGAVQGMKALLEAPPTSDEAYVARAEELISSERASRPAVLLAYSNETRSKVLEQGYGEQCLPLIDEVSELGLEPRFFYRHIEAVGDCLLTATAQHAASRIN